MRSRANFRIKAAVSSHPLLINADIQKIFPSSKSNRKQQVRADANNVSNGTLKCYYYIYKTYRFFYTSMYFYWFPFTVILLPFYALILSDRIDYN
jgi:hypothetical protein